MYKKNKIKKILNKCKLRKSEKKEFIGLSNKMPIKRIFIKQFIKSYCELECCCDTAIEGLPELKMFFYQTVLLNSFIDMAKKPTDNIDKILEDESKLETIFMHSFNIK
jgi:hypothetical protein